MTSINVLCPNGRRQVVKVTPNMTILQIIEEVCMKRGFEASMHDLKHGRTTLDITSPFRFSGVPNNAKLEMVERETERNSISEVTIALQLETGERRQKTVSANSTLSEMVKSFQQPDENLLQSTKSPDLTPIIINMREEVIGIEALANTTLKSKGIASGKVALRLVFRHVEQSVLSDISIQLEAEKTRLRKLTTNQPKLETLVKTVSNTPREGQAADVASVVSEQQDIEPMESLDTIPTSEPMVVEDAPDAIQSTREVQSSPPTKHLPKTEAVSQATSATTDSCNVPPAVAAPSLPTTTPQQQQIVRPKEPVYQPPPLMEFKFPEETAGKNVYDNEMSDVQPADYLPCERELTVFSMAEARSATSTEEFQDVTDDFFEVTKDDLQKLIRHLRDQASADENAPLMTSSMRQAQLESSYSKYESAVIRFNFPDKLVLQAKFKPKETVHSLNKFVTSHLKNPMDKFHLYITPPKKVLSDPATTLIQAQLVPMAIIYVGFDKPSAESYLSPETVALKKSKQDADSFAKQSLPKVDVIDSASSGKKAAKQVKVGADGSMKPIKSTSGSSAASTSGVKSMPKWYKPPGK